MIGAVAGASPLLVDLINIDAGYLNDLNPMVFFGILIKAAGLMFLGGFLVYVNSETDKWKAFQIGIMAPAVIIGAMNANNLKETKADLRFVQDQLQDRRTQDQNDDNGSAMLFPGDEVNEKRHFFFSLTSSAYAQSNEGLQKGIHKKQDSLQKFLSGITGKTSNSWFVMAGSHKKEKEAKEQAKDLSNKGYDVRVYPPFGGSKYFGVAIGSNLNKDEAIKLKKQARKDGLSKDTYLWKFQP